MECLVASQDPLLQAAAQTAGFAAAMVQDTPTGKVVLTRHRFSPSWGPFFHLAPGQCALDAFYGCAFWERADVLAMCTRNEESRLVSASSVKEDIGKDFRREFTRKMRGDIEGDDLAHVLRKIGMVRR